MFMIVAHHYVLHSGLLYLMSQDTLSFRSIYLYLFGMWGKTGINCFVLITGYFMCRSNISLRKYTILFFQIEFYNLLFFILFACAGYYNSYSIKDILKILFPFDRVGRVFPESFLLFYLLIPFLNILIKNINNIRHGILILILLTSYSIMSTFSFVEVKVNYVIWFCILYLISSYIRLYGFGKSINPKVWGMTAFLFIILSMLSVILFLVNGETSWPFFYVSDSNKVLPLLVSVCFFMFFNGIHVPQSKFINTIGASTFGILLIHDNSPMMREWLWKKVFNNTDWYYNNIFYHSIVCVVCIYFICSSIDLIRLQLFEMPLIKAINKKFRKNDNILSRWWWKI